MRMPAKLARTPLKRGARFKGVRRTHVMTRIQYISVSLILFSAFMALTLFLYHQESNFDALTIAEPLSKVSSDFIPDIGVDDSHVSMRPAYSALTENRSIAFAAVICVTLCIAAFNLVRTEKKTRGIKGIQDVIMAGSVSVIVTILATLLKVGFV